MSTHVFLLKHCILNSTIYSSKILVHIYLTILECKQTLLFEEGDYFS